MSFLGKLFESLATLEEEVVMKLMWEFYGPLFHWGMIFPRYRPEHLAPTLVLWFLYITLFPLHFVLLAWSVILELDSLELWGLLFHFELLLTFGILCVCFFNTERQRVAENHWRAANDMGSYPGGRIYLEEKPIEMKKLVDKETLFFMVMPVFVGILAGSVFFVPYVAKFGTEVEPYSKNGVNVNLPIPMFYPFPTHEGILHLVAIVLQLATAALLATVVVALLLALIRFTQRMKYEYLVLGYVLQTLLKRAAKLYRTDHPGNREIKTSDPLYQAYVGVLLRRCVIHHLKLMEFMRTFDEAQLNWPGAFAYLVGTGSIGLALITISSSLKTNDYQAAILFALLGVGEVMSLFLMSLIGETVTTASKNFRDQLYDIEWYKFDLRNRKIMLNFQVGVTEPYVMRAGGLVDICLDTFSSIMNSSYSFFNLINVGVDG